MRLPQHVVLRSDERKRQEEELQKLRDERVKAITQVMTQATIPTVVVHIESKEEAIAAKVKQLKHG